MLIRHASDMYSWGDNGSVYVGAKAKMYALIHGVSVSGIEDFRVLAKHSGVATYQIEMSIAEYRAKSQTTTRDNTRPGDDDLDNPGDSPSDINSTVAHSHGTFIYSCGHISSCRCRENVNKYTLSEACYDCKNKS
jgi:hypothetical protein